MLILFLVVIALLAIPVALEFDVAWPDHEHNEVLLVWALGLVRMRIRSRESRPSSTSAESLRESGPRKKKTTTKQASNVLAAIRRRPFRQRLYRFVGELWRSVTKDNIRIRARIGLDDPADTGRLWAVLGPISGVATRANGVSIAIAPIFVDEVFDVAGRGRIQLVPLRVIVIFAGLIFSPVVWRGFRDVRNA